METNFNFKSQICTTREQSERLLALGLKKETADMSHRYSNIGGNYEESVFPYSSILALKERMNKPILGRGWEELYGRDIPAWSLDRLRELIPENIFTGVRNQWYRVMYNGVLTYEEGDDSLVSFREANIYDRCISCIEWLINEGYFNKEYLV